jgi:hypothetical protein
MMKKACSFLLLALGAEFGYSQSVQVHAVANLTEGQTQVALKFHAPARVPSTGKGSVLGISSSSGEGGRVQAIGLPSFTADFDFAGKQLPMHIIGSDPKWGAYTTTIPTILIPLRFIFANPGNPILDGTNVVSTVKNSPIFQDADYQSGSVDLGVTQYGDALQRAQFWKYPNVSKDYHVRLGQPTIAPTITVTVPANLGNAYPLSGGGYLGVVDDTFLYDLVTSAAFAYPPDQLPIVITDNVYSGAGGLIVNCCVLGFHEANDAPVTSASTLIFAGYAEPGTFTGPLYEAPGLEDVAVLSHEIGEWLNDPYVGAVSEVNWAPPAVLPDSGGACIANAETADPLSDGNYIFTKVTNSTTYHLVDQVFVSWYTHTTPSHSVNGWYTFQNLSGAIPLVVNSPSRIRGSYTDTADLFYAPVTTPVIGNVAYVGRGCPADSITGTNPDDPYLASPAGKIALIDRGTCAVSLKIDRAARAGAIGVLIDLVAPGDAASFGYYGGTMFVPSLVITESTGDAIKTQLGSLLTWPTFTAAADVAVCDAACTTCNIRRNIVLQLPPACLASGGDVLITGANSTRVTNLFRAFNNYVDTGGGTGLSTQVMLYSTEDNTRLPDPSTYSVNRVEMPAAASGSTSYFGPGGGILYLLDTAAVATRLRLSGDAAAVPYNSLVQLTALLTVPSTGVAIPNARVQFAVGSQSCTAQTNASGVATCGVTLNQNPGIYTLVASFTGIFGVDAATSVCRSFVIKPGH